MLGRMVLNRVTFPLSAWAAAAAVFAAVKTTEGLNSTAVQRVQRILTRGGSWESALQTYHHAATCGAKNPAGNANLRKMRSSVSYLLMQDETQWRRSVEMLRHELLHRDEPHPASAGHVMQSLSRRGEWRACLATFAVLVRVVASRSSDASRWAGVFGMALEAVGKKKDAGVGMDGEARAIQNKMIEFGVKHLHARFVMDSRGHSAVVEAAAPGARSFNKNDSSLQRATDASSLIRGYAAQGRWLVALCALRNLPFTAEGGSAMQDELRLFVLRSSNNPDVTIRIASALAPLVPEETLAVVIWLRGSSKWREAAELVAAALRSKRKVDAAPSVSAADDRDDKHWTDQQKWDKVLISLLSNLVGGMRVPVPVAEHCAALAVQSGALYDSQAYSRLAVGHAEAILCEDDLSPARRCEAVSIIRTAAERYGATLPASALSLLHWTEIPRSAVAFSPAFHLITTRIESPAAQVTSAWEKAFFLCSCLARVSDHKRGGKVELPEHQHQEARRHRTGPFVGQMLRNIRVWTSAPSGLIAAVSSLLDGNKFDVNDEARAATVVEAAALLLRSAHSRAAVTLVELFLPAGGRPLSAKALPLIVDMTRSFLPPAVGEHNNNVDDDVFAAAIEVSLMLYARIVSGASQSTIPPYAAEVLNAVKELARLQKLIEARGQGGSGEPRRFEPAWQTALQVAGIERVTGTRRGGALLTTCLGACGPSQWIEAAKLVQGLEVFVDLKHVDHFASIFGVECMSKCLGKSWPQHCDTVRSFRKGTNPARIQREN